MQHRHHGRYTQTDYTAIKVLLSSILFCWIVLHLNWKEIIPQIYAEPAWADPRSDAKIVEVPYYITPQTIQEKICAVFTEDCKTALKVAKCESGFNPKAKNKQSSARGLFQIMSSVHQVKEAWLFNPDTNIQIAHDLYIRQGWGPWTSSKSCWGN